MHFEKIDQPLPKNEAAYRLQPDAPVAQLDRVRGYEPHSRFPSLPHGSAVSSLPTFQLKLELWLVTHQ